MSKLSKKQKRSAAHYWVEVISIPLLILSTSVLFTYLGTVDTEVLGLHGLSLVFFAVVSIVALANSIFCKRVLKFRVPKAEVNSKWLDRIEQLGAASSIVSFFSFIAVFSAWLAFLLFWVGLLIFWIGLKAAQRILDKELD